MKRYDNLSGSSGVSHYEIRAEEIIVRFIDSRDLYHYTWQTPGKAHVEAMKTLATAGRGLSTYISRHVRDQYARRTQAPDRTR